MDPKTNDISIDTLEGYRQYISSRATIEFDKCDDLESKIKSFYKSVAEQFPDKPEKNPHEKKYLLRSKSSGLLLFVDRLVWETRYFGNYVQDYDLCHNYVYEKLFTAFKGIKTELGQSVRFLSLITNAQISCNGLDVEPVSFIQKHYLALTQHQGPYSDLSLRVALEQDKKYYINFEIGRYWSRGLEQVGPLPEKRTVRLHELQTLDTGIRLTVDVNTKRDAFERLPDYKENDLQIFLDITREAVGKGLTKFLRKEV